MGGAESSSLAKETGLAETDIKLIKTKYDALRKKQGTNETVKLTRDQFISHFPRREIVGEIIFAALDSGQTGVIDFREFVIGLCTLAKGTHDEKLRMAFDLYDVSRSGYISKSDFRRLVTGFFGSFKRMLESTQSPGSPTHPDRQPPPLRPPDAFGNRAEEFEKAITAVYSSMDVSGSERVSFEDFQRFAAKNPEVFGFLENILSQVQHASYWDWDTAGTVERNAITPSMCLIM